MLFTIYWFLTKRIDAFIKWLDVGVFEHHTRKSKVKDFLLVKQYRLEKRYMLLKELRPIVRYRLYQSFFDFFTPLPSLPYTLWDISGYIKRKYYLNGIRHAAKSQTKLEKRLDKQKQKCQISVSSGI